MVVMSHIQNNNMRHAVMVLSVILMPFLIILLGLQEGCKVFCKEVRNAWSYTLSKEYNEDFKECWKEASPGKWWQ